MRMLDRLVDQNEMLFCAGALTAPLKSTVAWFNPACFAMFERERPELEARLAARVLICVLQGTPPWRVQ